jgi:hypothetical protein
MSDPVIWAPCFFTGFGSLAGLITMSCLSTTNCLPVIIGSSVCGGLGCIYCTSHYFRLWKYPEEKLPIAPPIKKEESVIVQNNYIIYVIGQSK